MKKILLFIVVAFFFLNVNAQEIPYWQQEVNYSIDVTLNDKDNSLDANMQMQYVNHSPDTLHFIWIHCWPNAYKNDRTAFSDQQLENGSTDFYFSSEEKRGYINRINFTVDGVAAHTKDHPQHQDIIQLILPKPIAPGSSIKVETPFHVKLPFNFSRGGFVDKSYQVTQWYPKPAVYDRKGWHPMPYLDQGEFYSEFGKYEVKISVPENYIIASAGILKEESRNGGILSQTYIQDNVHDFAWFADTGFIVVKDTLQLPGKIVEVVVYYHEKNKDWWKNGIAYTKDAILTKSKWLGEYPYETVKVVDHAGKANGGMEYPTITLIGTFENEMMMDMLINHEVGHNWFYGILASNERLHPWMDEGMNSYYDRKYLALKYGKSSVDYFQTNSAFLQKRLPADVEMAGLQTITGFKADQPIETHAEHFSGINYNLIAYTKTAQWMSLLELVMGTELFDSLMKRYYAEWKFRHPYPEDFKDLATAMSPKNLDAIFALQTQRGSLTYSFKKQFKLQSYFGFRDTDKYNHIFISPVAGYNFYDKFMPGLLLHNYTLPMPRLRFFATALYGTGTRQVNGMGGISLNTYRYQSSKIEIGINGASFNGDSFRDSTGKNNFMRFSKLVPFVKYVFPKKNARSQLTKQLGWKTFLIAETGLVFSRDTLLQVDKITYPVSNRYINQLSFEVDQARVLYPWNATLMAEQGKSFVRLNFTGNYFFNYPGKGGLNLRLFAGKFIYTTDRTFLAQYETDRYHLNMSGPKGHEDYTYSNYFIGRNEFEGFSNQQIMIRDGGFKVRTDLLSNKIGRTDDWLAAANITTTIPSAVNPLELTPLKLPLKIFVDVGTYAEAWDKDATTGRFLYDAGLQLSFLKNAINIYFPLVYSKVYSDYFKSTLPDKRFLRNISFSLDVQKLQLKKLFPGLDF